MNLSIFKNKKILITGHNSFVGASLCLWLSQYTDNITGFSLYKPSTPCHYDMLELKNSVTDIKGDIRKFKDIEKAVKESNPEIIIDLASKTLVLESYHYPVNYYNTNIMGRVNLLEAVRQNGKEVKTISVVTTDKVYLNSENMLAYKEEDRLGGNDPYASSKAGAELIASAYRASFFKDMGISVNTLRAGNILGLDFADNRLIPNIVRVLNNEKMKNVPWQAFKSNKKILIREGAIRPWQHINDVCLGYLTLTAKAYEEPNKFSEAWNFGPDYSSIRTVKEVAEEFIRFWYNDRDYDTNKILKKYNVVNEPKHHEDKLLILDSVKARIKLGWRPQYNFNEMVKSVADMYSNFYNKKNMNKYTRKELSAYIKKLVE